MIFNLKNRQAIIILIASIALFTSIETQNQEITNINHTNNILSNVKVEKESIPVRYATNNEINENLIYKCFAISYKDPKQIILNPDWFSSLSKDMKTLVIEDAKYLIQFANSTKARPHFIETMKAFIEAFIFILFCLSGLIFRKLAKNNSKPLTYFLFALALSFGLIFIAKKVFYKYTKAAYYYSEKRIEQEYITYFMKETGYQPKEILDYLNALETGCPESYKNRKDHVQELFKKN